MTNKQAILLKSQTEIINSSTDAELSLYSYEVLWREDLNDGSKQTYTTAVNQFIKHYGINHPADFRAVTMDMVVEWKKYLKKSGLANSSINTKLAGLTSIYDFLKNKGVVKYNPAEDVRRPKVDASGKTPAMTNQQVKLLLSQPDQDKPKELRDYAILCFYFYTGGRISAPTSLFVSDYYQDRGFYVLRYTVKGEGLQTMPVHPTLQDALQRYLESNGHNNDSDSPLFQANQKGNNDGTKPLSRSGFAKVWNKYRDKAGLDKKFTVHSARATFATMLDEQGVNLQDIQSSLQHAQPSTTQNYIQSRKGYQEHAVFKADYS